MPERTPEASDGRRGPPDKYVDSGPFIDYLLSTDRRGWTNRLSESQQRYVERVLDRRPAHVDVHNVDEILVTLDRPWVLHALYPD